MFGFLKHVRNLKELNLNSSHIGDHGATLLADGLKFTSGLKLLDLTWNGIGFDGAKSLGTLENMSKLQELYMSNNGIGPEFPASLLTTFGQMKKLSVLKLSYNFIDSRSATQLAGVIVHMQNLKEIVLSQNCIGNGGAASLASAFKQMSRLKNVCLFRNEFDVAGAKLLINATKRMTYLRSLFLDVGFGPKRFIWEFLGKPRAIGCEAFWGKKQLESLKKAHRQICKMLVTSRLSLKNAQVGAEYSLPDEMVEEISEHLCPIEHKGFEWMFNYEGCEGPIFQ